MRTRPRPSLDPNRVLVPHRRRRPVAWLGAVAVAVLGGGCPAAVAVMPDAAPGLPATCSDFRLDGNESDVDCGGDCGPCGYGQSCRAEADCARGRCSGGRCSPTGTTCYDRVLDGRETGVDCGGVCPKCAAGAGCRLDAECESGACKGGVCSAGRGPFVFAAPRFADAGNGAVALVVVDLDGDGHLDVATANAGDDTVSVLLGGGDGTLRPTATLAVGHDPRWVGAADFDGDGRLDLAVLLRGDGGFDVLGGQGGGQFAARRTFTSPTALSPFDATLADFDDDGHTDLLMSGGSGALTLFSGRAGGDFDGGSPLGPGGIAPSALAGGDFDGDGRADVAVLADMLVQVFHGRPLAATAFIPGPSSYGLGAFDLRRRGILDVVVTRLDGTAAVFAGNGDGTFAQGMAAGDALRVGQDPFSVVAADFDGDGHLDLATGNQGSVDISLVAGHGDGTFESAIELWVGGSLQRIATADMNQDGKPDLLVTDYFQHDVGVLLNGRM